MDAIGEQTDIQYKVNRTHQKYRVNVGTRTSDSPPDTYPVSTLQQSEQCVVIPHSHSHLCPIA